MSIEGTNTQKHLELRIDGIQVLLAWVLENCTTSSHNLHAIGRLAASEALSLINAPKEELLTGSIGNPIFPAGFQGSISHTTDNKRLCGAAAVSKQSGVSGIGIDIEFLTRTIRPDLALRISNEAERASLNGKESLLLSDYLTGLPSAVPVALLFHSIKEAAYKALSPALGKFQIYQNLRVICDPELREGSCHGSVIHTLSQTTASFEAWVFEEILWVLAVWDNKTR